MDRTTKIIDLEVEVTNDSFFIKNDPSLTSNAKLVLEVLLEETPQHFEYYLTELDSSQIDLFACNILYNFYAPCYDPDYENPPKRISLFNTATYYPQIKQKIIGNEILGDIPNGIYYEIKPYSYNNQLEIRYHFFYKSEEDEINNEELHVTIKFQN